MKDPQWMLSAMVILESVMMLLLPNLSPRHMYFGIRTGAEFRQTQAGRRVRAQYRGLAVAWLALTLALLWGVPGIPEQTAGFIGMLPIVGALVAFVRAYFQVRRHALPPVEVREADLAPAESGLPWWGWLVLPPFAGPLAAMLYLRAHWDAIPARIPVHFGIHGEPDRWVTRTERAVFAPFWFAEGMILLLLLLGAAVLLGSRRSIRPTAMPGVFLGGAYVAGFNFSAVGLAPVMQIPGAAMIGVTLMFVIVVLVWAYRRNSDSNAPLEVTPDECWTLGGIYKNPNDPAIFVQKRVGFGYTINFGNVWSYVVMGGFTAGMIALAAFMRWAMAG